MNFAAASTTPVTNASVQEYSKKWRTNLVTVRSPLLLRAPRSSVAGLTTLLKLGGKVTARCPKFKQRYLSGAGEGSSACRRALYQMPNTSNVTRPWLTACVASEAAVATSAFASCGHGCRSVLAALCHEET